MLIAHQAVPFESERTDLTGTADSPALLEGVPARPLVPPVVVETGPCKQNIPGRGGQLDVTPRAAAT